MTFKTLTPVLLALSALTACETTPFGLKAPDITLDSTEPEDTELFQAVLITEDTPAPLRAATAQPILPRTFGPQLDPTHLADIDDKPSVRPDIAIDAANADAAIQPHPDNYLNAVQIYPYTHGALSY